MTELAADLQEIFLLGPTASGKDRTAALLASRLSDLGHPTEVLCMDSMKVYRGLPVTTDAPTPADRALARFHLLEIVAPSGSFSTGTYVEAARDAAAAIRARSVLPLWAGGTVLYYRALMDGLFRGPGASPELRRRLEAEHAARGGEALHRRLAAVDPVTAARVHPNDRLRIVRALEVFELTGSPLGAQATSWREARAGPAAGQRVLGIFPPWEELQRRIETRAAAILAPGGAGLAEVEAVLAGDGFSRQARHALGVQEAIGVLEGRLEPAAAATELARRTRRLAKAQRTWFRSLVGVEWHLLDPGATPETTCERLLATLAAPPAPTPARF
jgi:tRNA dimethylallyltransferase